MGGSGIGCGREFETLAQGLNLPDKAPAKGEAVGQRDTGVERGGVDGIKTRVDDC